MHERRNFVMVLLLAASIIWAVAVWLVLDPARVPAIQAQRVVSILVACGAGAFLVYALKFEDHLPDHLAQVVGPIYYEADGVSFMPTVRNHGGSAELCVYYQNRYENPAQVIIHLRPPERCFVIGEQALDVHFAFRVGGGDFGVIRQPIAVPRPLQGEVVEVELGAACYYPRSHGSRWRKRGGMPVGWLHVDWGGSAFRTGVHEVSGEIELIRPTVIHLALPKGVPCDPLERHTWRQECVAVGVET